MPRLTEDPTISAITPTAAASLPCLLLVDDRDENLLALGAALEGLDCRLVTATSGEEALRAVLKEEFAAILMDVRMPGMDGIEAARLIKRRERSRETPILFLTADLVDEASILDAYDAGAVDYLSKPIMPGLLRAKVSVFIELYRSRLVIAEQAEALRQANLALAQEKALLEAVIQQVPAGVAFLDRNGIVRWINPGYLAMLGQPAARYIGRSLFGISADAAALRPIFDRTIATGEVYYAKDFEFVLPSSTGPRTTYWDFSYIPVSIDGRTEGILVFSLDVSDRHERECLQVETARQKALLQANIEALEAADRYKDEFLSVISHELRTPLNFITGFASILQDELHGPLNPPQHSALERILNGSDRMLVLVDDLLDFAKIQSGRFELIRESSTCEGMVTEALALLAPLAQQKELRLSSEVDVGASLLVDPHRVTQVLLNLIGNAIKFTPRGGQVTVRAVDEGSRLRIEVADTGIGIAADDISRLFTRFQQLDMSATRESGGTGLGLSICKAIVKAHQGEIGVTSELGAGSTFWFSLPYAPAA